MEDLMNAKVPTANDRGWEFVRYCRAPDLERAVMSADVSDDLRVAISSLAARLRRSQNSNIADELPYFSVSLAYEKAYGDGKEFATSVA
jgi:hypothetical protein